MEGWRGIRVFKRTWRPGPEDNGGSIKYLIIGTLKMRTFKSRHRKDPGSNPQSAKALDP